jgi:hypothetical protein
MLEPRDSDHLWGNMLITYQSISTFKLRFMATACSCDRFSATPCHIGTGVN